MDNPSAGIVIGGDFNKMKLELLCSTSSPTCENYPMTSTPTTDRSLRPSLSIAYTHGVRKVKAITRNVPSTKRSPLNELGVYLNSRNWEMVYNVNEIKG